MLGVYLLHFDPPWQHCKHYLGWSPDIGKRLEVHVAGRGARLIRQARTAGSKLILARVWENATPADEHRMKGRGLTELCPLCREADLSAAGG